MFKVHQCGVNTNHTNGACFVSKKLSNYLFMCFRTPFFYTVNGETFKGKAGDCLIHPKNANVSHGPLSTDTSFKNDWFYFSFDKESAPNVLLNTAVHTQETAQITSLICEIIKETAINDTHSPKIISNKIEHILTIFTRSTKNLSHTATTQQLTQLRTQIHNNLQEKWTLEQMANSMGYSVSRFCALYTKEFGISPMNDLIGIRIEKAKQLLKMQTYTISDVATMCGFSSIHYFSKCFKSRENLTPSEYILKSKDV